MTHSVTPDSPLLEDRAALARLAALRDEGVTVGLSVSGPAQSETLRRALSVRIDGREVFSAVQATWNLLEPSAGPALQEAHERGWGVIVKEAVANGRLTTRGAEAAHPAMRAACDSLSVTPDVVALAAVLAQPFVHVVLSGAATVEQIESNARAMSVPVNGVGMEELGGMKEEPEAYWSTRSGLDWN